MPNWVFNHISNYTEDLYNKYKSDEADIDFNKVIPEPEEITNTPSGSYNDTAKNIYKYKQYRDNLAKGIDIETELKYSRNNPLHEEVREFADRAVSTMGALAIQNPDESLHQILDKEKHRDGAKHIYDKYVGVFGNNTYLNSKDHDKVYSNYIDMMNRRFEDLKERSKESDYSADYSRYNDLEDLGKQLVYLKEKYGYDNWYDWRCANWGTKWNACEPEYNSKEKKISFDTAWSIPYPIIAKMVEDNPDAKIEGYSEEETGWFDEYHSNKGKLYIDARGELEWDEEGEDPVEKREELNPPEEYTYEHFKKLKLPWNS